MLIIGLTDVHSSARAMAAAQQAIDEADLVVFAGDITNFGRREDVEKIISPVLRQGKQVLAVAGNCDFPEVEAYLTDQKINLHGQARMIADLGIIGLGGSLITPFQTPNELTETEIETMLAQAWEKLPDSGRRQQILISHQPPLQTLCDRLSSGDHVGSRAVREYIQVHQPLVCITGHIHEAIGVDHIGRTAIINSGQLVRGGYARVQIDSGQVQCELGRTASAV